MKRHRTGQTGHAIMDGTHSKGHEDTRSVESCKHRTRRFRSAFLLRAVRDEWKNEEHFLRSFIMATRRRMKERGFELIRLLQACYIVCWPPLRTFRAAVSVPSTSKRAMMRGFLVTDMVQREYGRTVRCVVCLVCCSLLFSWNISVFGTKRFTCI